MHFLMMPVKLDSPLGLGLFFIAILLLFGPQRVPEIAKQLQYALRAFRGEL